MKVNLTKLELDAILGAAENMKDDFEQYFNFMPKKKHKLFCEAYETGMKKLKAALYNKLNKKSRWIKPAL